MPEIRVFRADGDADLQHSIDVYNAVHPRDPVGVMETRELERQSRGFAVFLAELDGGLAGAAHVHVPSFTDTPGASVYVLSQQRAQGVGQALYESVSSWAAERRAETLRGGVDEDDPGSLAWAERRGFRERARDQLVELDLAECDPRPAAPPPGVEIVTWAERPDLARGLYEVVLEAWPDIPGSEEELPEPFEEWLSVHMLGAGDRPEGTFVALAGDEVVGYAKFSFWEAKPDTLYHDLTGVKRAWRGRGIARALKHAQIAWAKREGFAFLRTSNEQRNEPIRHLNEQLGYRPIPGRIRLEGPLAPRP